MAVLGLAGMATFLVASLVVGLRLVVLWTKTRQLPELMIGISFLLAGAVGGVASTLGGELMEGDPRLATLLLQVGNLGIHAGVICLVVFVGRVFRPSSRGRAATAAVCLLLAAVGLLVGSDRVASDSLWNVASIAIRIGVYAWAALESGLEWRAALRRQRLGLADGVVVNRYLLWMLGTGAIVLLWMHTAWRMGTGGGETTGADYLVIATLGMLCAASLWLAFFPPDAWTRRYATADPT